MSQRPYWARLIKCEGSVVGQSLDEHLNGVAELAGRFADVFDASEWGRLAGTWHDVGKFSLAFQAYLERCAFGENNSGVRGPDHSSAGAQHAVAKFGHKFGKVLAYCLAGHHAGLLDGDVFDQSAACLRKRLEKTDLEDWSACPDSKLEAADPPRYPFPPPKEGRGFHFSFFIRMLFSCLVDADFLNTERFMDRTRFDERGTCPDLKNLKSAFDAKLASVLKEAASTRLNAQRATILSHCCARAISAPGLFSLTVPTGGGKTLSSMAFALDHAVHHSLDRIIYVMPFTSIIEQNAQVFRDVLGDDAILEHHSSFDPDNYDTRGRLATENWDAPVIVTTAVQFFESLFASRTSRCRKLHNLARSVIVLDEAQTLPRKYLEPCLAALRELASFYGASVVLCTATQPALERTDEFRAGLDGIREIIPDARSMALAPEFRRVRFNVEPEPWSDEMLVERLTSCGQALCIVNTRRHAREVYAALRDALGSDAGLCHLSGYMCAAHRSQQLAQVRERLKAELRCVLISTSLVEAGVDISFPGGYRAMAGLDQIIQAAGRCNREGAGEKGTVHVFTPLDAKRPGYLAQPVAATRAVMQLQGDSFDPLDPATITEYFRELFWLAGNELDKKDILPAFEREAPNLNFPFATVAREFQIMENVMQPVIVPYDERAEKHIQALRHSEHPGSILRRLQPYIVQIMPAQVTELGGYIEMVHDQYRVLRALDGVYRDDVGLDVEGVTSPDAASLIV